MSQKTATLTKKQTFDELVEKAFPVTREAIVDALVGELRTGLEAEMPAVEKARQDARAKLDSGLRDEVEQNAPLQALLRSLQLRSEKATRLCNGTVHVRAGNRNESKTLELSYPASPYLRALEVEVGNAEARWLELDSKIKQCDGRVRRKIAAQVNKSVVQRAVGKDFAAGARAFFATLLGEDEDG